MAFGNMLATIRQQGIFVIEIRQYHLRRQGLHHGG